MALAEGFCDLNIPVVGSDTKKIVLKALSLGYRTIALNTTVQDSDLLKKAKEIRPPEKLILTSEDLISHNIVKPPVILTRITINHGSRDLTYLTKYKSVIAQYDIIAISPQSQNAFDQFVGSPSFDFDILSIPSQSKQICSQKLIRRAAQKGLYVELQYSQCLSTPTRQTLLLLALYLQKTSRSINVLITSGAVKKDLLRNPYDVTNLARFFGLTEGAARSAINTVAHDVVYCALARRKGAMKCVAEVMVLDKANENVRKKFKGIEDARNFATEVVKVLD